MAESLGVEGSDEELISMFGAGWWKHDEEAATKLLEKAGLEKVNGVWNYEGKPFNLRDDAILLILNSRQHVAYRQLTTS